MTKQIGLLFTPENRALVRSGLKTQTRRLLKFPAPFAPGDTGAACDLMALSGDIQCPYGAPEFGPVQYYLKEPVQVLELIDGAIMNALIRYADDGAEARVIITPGDYHKLVSRRDWRKPSSSMFMLRSFARTWMAGVRTWPERLGDMSEADALAEGIFQVDDGITEPLFLVKPPSNLRQTIYSSGKDAYKALWNSINGKTHPWATGLWVWCVEWQPPAVAMEVAA